MDLDAKRWPDAKADDASSVYKVMSTTILHTEAQCLPIPYFVDAD